MIDITVDLHIGTAASALFLYFSRLFLYFLL